MWLRTRVVAADGPSESVRSLTAATCATVTSSNRVPRMQDRRIYALRYFSIPTLSNAHLRVNSPMVLLRPA
jgi:hypothetical protein